MDDPGSAMSAGSATALRDYVAAGGTLAIGDYAGLAFWNTVLGFTAGGILSGIDGVTGYDPGLSTARGLAAGFDASYADGNFGHQAYDPVFWTAHGYSALQTVGAGQYVGAFATMESITRDVPEPGSIALIGLGLLGLISGSRKARKS